MATMAENETGNLPDSQAQSETSTSGFEQVQEFLYNLVQDAQASGSIVCVVAIIPPSMQTTMQHGKQEPFSTSCQPKSGTCPKRAN